MCSELEGGGKKTIPFQSTTNVPVLYTASSSMTMSYQAFTATFDEIEASFSRREKVLEYLDLRDLMDNIKLVPEEFIAEENLNYNKEVSVNEGVTDYNETIKMSNLPPPLADTGCT
jgi:hypothetical protein